MNWAAIAAIGSFFGIIATIASVSFFSGRFSEQLKVNVAETQANRTTLNEHRDIIDGHAMQIDRLEQWRNGYNAAANVSGGSQLPQTGH
jgi:hypothetical protein